MSGPVLAILLTAIVHFIGFILLFAMLGKDMIGFFRSSSSGGGDGGLWPEPEPPADPAPSGTGIPLPDADPSSVRLREPGRIAERYERRPRRPDHAPEPARTPERV
jgi:hypothetical protein